MSLIPRKINFDVFVSPRKKGESQTYHVRIVESEVVDTEELLKEHVRPSHITDVKNLLATLVSSMKEELRKGNKVRIEGLGLFELVPTADVVRRTTPYHGRLFDVDNVRVRNIAFRPEKHLVNEVQEDVDFNYKSVLHDYTPNEEKIDEMLTFIFKKSDSIMRRDLMNTFALKPKAATRLLERLTQEGRLIRKGRTGASYYIPTPGNFGR